MAYRGQNNYFTVGEASYVVNNVSGLQDGDLMFTLIRRDNDASPTTVPSGWNLIATTGGTFNFWLYYKIASSEPSTYTWAWGSNARAYVLITAFYDLNLDTVTPIQSNSTPTNSGSSGGTAVTCSTQTTASDNTWSFIFGTGFSTASKTYTTPSPYTEHVDLGSTAPDFWGVVASYQYPTASTVTGDISFTASASVTWRSGIQVLVNTTGGGGGSTFKPRIMMF